MNSCMGLSLDVLNQHKKKMSIIPSDLQKKKKYLEHKFKMKVFYGLPNQEFNDCSLQVSKFFR